MISLHLERAAPQITQALILMENGVENLKKFENLPDGAKQILAMMEMKLNDVRPHWRTQD